MNVFLECFSHCPFVVSKKFKRMNQIIIIFQYASILAPKLSNLNNNNINIVQCCSIDNHRKIVMFQSIFSKFIFLNPNFSVKFKNVKGFSNKFNTVNVEISARIRLLSAYEMISFSHSIEMGSRN